MIYPQPTFPGNSDQPEHPIPIQRNDWLRGDMTSLRILVVLNVCTKADSATLVEMLNRDSPLHVDLGAVEDRLTRLEQSGYIRGQRSVSLAVFWQRTLKAPLFSITNSGKDLLSQGLAALNKSNH